MAVTVRDETQNREAHMLDDFETQAVTLTSPAIGGAQISPDDSTDLGFVTRAIYVGGSGTLSVVMQNGDTVVLTSVQAGIIYPLRIRRVLATGTTATNLVALG